MPNRTVVATAPKAREKQQKNADEELENIAAVKKQLTHGKA